MVTCTNQESSQYSSRQAAPVELERERERVGYEDMLGSDSGVERGVGDGLDEDVLYTSMELSENKQKIF